MTTFTVSPAVNGFLKGLGFMVVLAAAAYCSDAANLSPVVGNTLSVLLASLASSLESYIKEQTGRGLMGAVKVS